MNFLELQNEVILNRFTQQRRPSVKSWINFGYAQIWDYFDWPFKRVSGANLAIVSGDATPTMPADFGRATRLYDERGEEIPYIRPNEWEFEQFPVPPSSGRVSRFTIVNGAIELAPTPSLTTTYRLSYKRRLSHVDAGLGVVGGIMAQDTDQPIWDAEWDYLLVLETQMLGMQLLSDPTALALQPARDSALARMKSALLEDIDEQAEIWGVTRY